MAHSQCTRVGNGSATEFSIDFDLGYLLEKEVTAIVDGENTERDIFFISTNMVRVYGTPVPNNVNIIFTRTVPKDSFYVNFDDGNVITKKNLDTAFKQNMMATHEALDKAEALRVLIQRAVLVPADEGGITIGSVSTRALKAFGFDAAGGFFPLPLNPVPIGVPGPDTVGAAQIQNLSITGAKIAPATLTADKFTPGIGPSLFGAGTLILTFATRALMAAYTPQTQVVAKVYGEGGRKGDFLWTAGDQSVWVAQDASAAIFVPPTSAPTGASGCWIRIREHRWYNIEWFGVDAAVADNYTNVTRAITLVNFMGGGTIYFPAFYQIATEVIVNGNDIRLQGSCQSSGLFRSTAGRVIKFTGSRHDACDILFSANTWTVDVSHFIIWVDDAVGLSLDRVRTVGGYKAMAVTGGACADNTFTRCSFTFVMGTSMIYLADATNGVNGAHHFYRCTFNQGYPVSSPNGTTTFKGARGNSTVYAIGDIVSIGSHYYQCLFAGTTGAAPPSTVGFWFGQGITDNTVGWLLTAHTSFTGTEFSTNTYYCVVRECDFTAPYQFCARVRNEFAQDAPQDILFERCTFHGPISIGIWIEAGNAIILDKMDMWHALDNTAANTYGVLNTGSGDLRILDCGIYKFKVGISCTVSTWQVRGGSIIGHSVAGINVGNGTTTWMVQGVNLGQGPYWGGNALPIVIGTGCSYYNVTNNMFVGSAGAISNGSAGATGSTVTGNF